jgi:hypothetical protein
MQILVADHGPIDGLLMQAALEGSGHAVTVDEIGIIALVEIRKFAKRFRTYWNFTLPN